MAKLRKKMALKIARKDLISAIELHFYLNEKRRNPKMTELTCRRYTLFVSSFDRRGIIVSWLAR